MRADKAVYWGSRNPLQKSSSHLSPGKRCEATAQSALGWYRPSVGVPGTFGGYRSSGVLRLTIFSSVQFKPYIEIKLR
eukprot:scaffold48440_cov61-Phaeocystis_antarctica.AAC.2